MLIECPACHAQATVDSAKQGSKVRCGQCREVFVAQPAPRRPRKRMERDKAPTGLILGGAVVVLGGATLFFLIKKGERSGGNQPIAAAETRDDSQERVDLTGWNSELVRTAVAIHQAAHEGNLDRLTRFLHTKELHAREVAAHAESGESTEPPKAFPLLTPTEKRELLERHASDILSGSGADLVADWEPYDGKVIEERQDTSVVRTFVKRRDSRTAEQRTVEWRLARDGKEWKAYSWERYLTPDELAALNRPKKELGYEIKTLSDGSVVRERQPEALPHLEDTPPELAARIDKLFATMIDLKLTRQASEAKRELEEIGKPSIPVLLTGLYTIPIKNEDEARQVNIIVQTLRSITGQDFGYKPQVVEGSGTGTTTERRDSAIRQWFAWWYRHGATFETDGERKDALESMIQLSEKDKRWLERNQKKN